MVTRQSSLFVPKLSFGKEFQSHGSNLYLCPNFPLGSNFGHTSAIFIIMFPQRLFWHPKPPFKNKKAKPHMRCAQWRRERLGIFIAFRVNYSSVSRCHATIACNDNLVLSYNIDDVIRATVSDIHTRTQPLSLTNAYATVMFPRFYYPHLAALQEKRFVMLAFHQHSFLAFSLSCSTVLPPRCKRFVFLWVS